LDTNVTKHEKLSLHVNNTAVSKFFVHDLFQCVILLTPFFTKITHVYIIVTSLQTIY